MRSVDWSGTEQIWEAFPDVIAAWAFGSAQAGRVGESSDLDVGVLFALTPSLDELADLRRELQQALQVDDIDLVVLNEASPILRFEVTCGRLLFCRDMARLAEFVSLTAREYEDEMAFLHRAVDALG
jgi:predicted nucleotidyltransferase